MKIGPIINHNHDDLEITNMNEYPKIWLITMMVTHNHNQRLLIFHNRKMPTLFT